MRLGDLDALKEDLKQYFSDGVLDGVSAKLAFNQILHDIDNAPTVDIKDEIAGAYNEGYICGSKEAEKARPQGEWVENLDRLGLSYICPFCGNEITGIPQDLNYCCKCGADMRTKEN